MHPSIEQILIHFRADHLPAELASVSRPFCELARSLAGALEGPELTVALRKLLESKDAAVRAAVVGGTGTPRQENVFAPTQPKIDLNDLSELSAIERAEVHARCLASEIDALPPGGRDHAQRLIRLAMRHAKGEPLPEIEARSAAAEITQELVRSEEEHGLLDLPSADETLRRQTNVDPARMCREYEIPSVVRAGFARAGAEKRGVLTWAHIATESLASAVASAALGSDRIVRKRLVHLGATTLAWIENIDRRAAASSD